MLDAERRLPVECCTLGVVFPALFSLLPTPYSLIADRQTGLD